VNKKYALVTGAAGFIGSNLTEALLKENRNVIAVDCFLPDLYSSAIKEYRWRSLANIDGGKLERIEFDLRVDDFSILKKYDIEVIFNQAAMPGLISDWGRFKPYYDCNVSSLNRLLEYARSIDISSFVQASTSSVYGKIAIGDENGELRPASPYGVSKLAAENLLLAYFDTYQMPAKILRYFSVFGPGQRPDMAISKLIQCLLDDVPFYIFGDGENRRSSTYIDDVLRATMMAETDLPSGEIVNICGEEDFSLLETISILEQVAKRKLNVQYLPKRPGDQRETKGSSLRALNLLGWKAEVKFIEGLERQYSAALELR
jgi:UDP-glucose 4-epimerase